MTTKKRAGRPAGTTGKARAITDEELMRALSQARQSRFAERNIAMLVLSNYLGLRAKELASLKVGDVYDGRAIVKTLRLFAAYTKGGKHRDVSLENLKVISALEDYIQCRQAEDGGLFNLQAPLFRTHMGSGFSPNTIARKFIALYAEAGIDNASSHTGRRSLITKLAYNGVDINMLRQIAGHKSITTTQAYIDDNPMKIKDILMSI
jgi:integrase/recombinase XerD